MAVIESTYLQEVQSGQKKESCTVEYVGKRPLQIRQLTCDTASFWSTGLSPAGAVGVKIAITIGAQIATTICVKIAITIGLRKNFRSHTQEHDFLSFVIRLV